MDSSTLICSCCKLPLADTPVYWAFPAPYLMPKSNRSYEIDVDDELFSVNGSEFYIRGLLDIPILDHDSSLSFAVSTSLSKPNYELTLEHWKLDNRQNITPPMPDWINSSVPGYDLRKPVGANVITAPVGERPAISVMYPEEHPLNLDQRIGISIEKAHGIVKTIMSSRL